MGWTYQNRPKGTSNRQFFEREFPGIRVIEDATVRSTYYAAVESRKTGEVFALVCLLSWRPRDTYNFGYKDMDESMGPCECSAPARVLDALTSPPRNEFAAAWRERARAYQSRPRIAFGDTIVTEAPIRFSFGEETTFTRVRYGKARNVYQTPDGKLVRIRNLQFVPYKKAA